MGAASDELVAAGTSSRRTSTTPSSDLAGAKDVTDTSTGPIEESIGDLPRNDVASNQGLESEGTPVSATPSASAADAMPVARSTEQATQEAVVATPSKEVKTQPVAPSTALPSLPLEEKVADAGAA
ncbi:MAG: hypothetical protein AAGJ83_03055, partial [Planctomycetota bacterium]